MYSLTALGCYSQYRSSRISINTLILIPQSLSVLARIYIGDPNISCRLHSYRAFCMSLCYYQCNNCA